MLRVFSRCDWLAVWILWSAWCSAAGWALSVAGWLDRAGYALTTLLFLALLFFLRRELASTGPRTPWLFRRSTYTRGLLPKLWLAGLGLIVLGGVLYHPDDYDYLNYRFPRLLNWWWAQHWFWIDTVDARENTSAVGMEWLMAPLFVAFRTDRLFFLINVVSFLFLPGLVFSVFRRLGVGRRMAWNWMWLLPFGYCFALQAGGMANDLFAAVPFLAALYYALRARAGAMPDASLSIISIALVTGDKASNIPLALPWLAVVWLNRRSFFASTRPVVLAGAVAVALVCSFLPLSLLNIRHTGSYTGDPLNQFHLQVKSPVAGVIGNSLEILTGALAPPFWPHALHFQFLSDAARAALRRGYPRYELSSVPFQIEDNAGIGLGVTLMAAASVLAGIGARLRGGAPSLPRGAWWFALATALAWGGYMAKMGSEAAPRLVCVYYVAGVLALLLLFPEDGAWPRHRLWRGAAGLVMLAVLPLLVLNPARPLLPASLTARALTALHAPPSAVAQLQRNQRLRASRRDIFQPLRLALPASEREVDVVRGLIDPEVSLWLPFGSRLVVRAHPDQPGGLGRHYAIVGERALWDACHLSVPELLQRDSLRIVQQEPAVVFKTESKPETWYLLAPAPAPR